MREYPQRRDLQCDRAVQHYTSMSDVAECSNKEQSRDTLHDLNTNRVSAMGAPVRLERRKSVVPFQKHSETRWTIRDQKCEQCKGRVLRTYGLGDMDIV